MERRSVIIDLSTTNYLCTSEQLHAYIESGCPKCGTLAAPEPTEEERQRIMDEPEYMWFPPDGIYLCVGFGLAFGGYGTYVQCDGCGFIAKCLSEE